MFRIKTQRPKIFILAFSLWLLSFAASATEIKEIQANGVKAWLVQDSILPIVSIEIAFKGAGSAYDQKNKLGLAYEVASMLNEGAGKNSSKEYQKLLEENAIGFSPDIDKDNFYITIKSLSGNLPMAVELTNLSLTKPLYTEGDLERIKGQTVSIIKKNEEKASYIAGRLMEKNLFKNHPYANPKEGTIESIANIAPADLHGFNKRNFAKDNIIIAIVGDIDEATAVQTLTALTANLPDKAEIAVLPEVPAFPKSAIIKSKMKNPQTNVLFAMPGISRQDKDYYAAYLLNHILGGNGFTSRLMAEVREKNGLAYSVGTGLTNLSKTNLFVGAVSTKNQSVDKSIQIINQELKKIAETGVTPRELKDAKDFIIGSFGLNLDKNENLSAFLISMQLYGLGKDYLDKRNEYFKSVTIEQVNEVAKRLILAENLVFIRVGM